MGALARLVVGAQVVAVPAGATVLLLARVGRQSLTTGWAATALTVSAVAAVPIPVEWDDGCNAHFGTTHAAAAAYVLLARPADTRLVLGGAATLRECSRALQPQAWGARS